MSKKKPKTLPEKITIPARHHWPKILLIVGVLAILVGVIYWFAIKSHQPEQPAQEEEVRLAASINGSMVPEEKAQLRPLAVVIENSPEARPQSGLSDAEIVYEAVAEGGITRFLAIFQAREPESIGPVRSARPYYNFLANVWGGGLVHSGGSEQALAELSSGVHKQVYDINEFFYGKYFSRDSSRLAPHNLYTTPTKLRELLEDKKQTAWQPMTIWQFENTPTDQLATEVTQITIPFSGDLFRVNYLYDSTTNSYLRSVASRAHTDRNNSQQISAKNILIHLTDITLNDDELGTMTIRLTGNGPCYLFASGKFQECRWRYENSRHIYTDTEGNPLKLQTGQTWVEIFPRDRQSQLVWN